MKKITQITFLLLFTFLSLYAQNTGSLRGFVTDSTSGEALPFCNVFINELNSGVSTDSRGYYIINKIPANVTFTVQYSFIGYQPKTVEFVCKAGKITELSVELVQVSFELGEVEKVENKITKQDKFDIGVNRLTLRNIEALPQAVESDVLRLLKTIPGVSSTGDISAKYYVRGGTGDQNLVLLNSISVYNPFHALGLFSVVDAEMINSMEFYKGEFSAKHGGRISSIMNITTKDGNRNKFSNTSNVSFLTAKTLVEGPYTYGSYIFTGRKSYSTFVLDEFLTEDNVPLDFYDFSFKVNYTDQSFLENGKFTLFGFFSGDNYDDPNASSADYKWGNDLAGFEWIQIFDKPFFSRFQFSYSAFRGEVIPNESDAKPKFNSVKDFTFAAEFTMVQDSKDQITFGLDFKNIRTELEEVNENSALINLSDFSGNYILYGNYELLQFDEFGFDAGVRFYLSGLSEKAGASLEPRFKGYWQPSGNLLFKLSAGTYRQEIATITDENEVISLFDPWTIYPDYLYATRSLNSSFGVEYFLNAQTNFSVELYYRDISNLVLVNEQKIFPGDPELLNGSGRAYGIENVITYELSNLSMNASYTLGWAFKSLNGNEYHPKYDSRHNVNLSFNYRIGSGWRFGINWAYNSGYPFTPTRGYFDRYELNNFFDYNPALDQYSIYTILGERNIKRLPDYHRLDLSVGKSFKLSFAEIELNLSVINVYDRKNIFYYDRDTGEEVNMLPLLPTASLKVKL